MAAISGHLFVGEHTWEEAQRLAQWLTAQLAQGTSSRIIGLADDAEDADGFPPGFPDAERWFENWQLEGELGEFYAKAVRDGADRIVAFNNNAYVDLVAVSGLPPSRDIAVEVLGTENVTEWSTEDATTALGEAAAQFI